MAIGVLPANTVHIKDVILFEEELNDIITGKQKILISPVEVLSELVAGKSGIITINNENDDDNEEEDEEEDEFGFDEFLQISVMLSQCRSLVQQAISLA